MVVQCHVTPLRCQRACLLHQGQRLLHRSMTSWPPQCGHSCGAALLMSPTTAAAWRAACHPRAAGTAAWGTLAAGPFWAAAAAAAQDLHSSAAASHRPAAQSCASGYGNAPRDIRHQGTYKGQKAKDGIAHTGTDPLQAECVKLSEQDVAPLIPHHCMKHSDVCKWNGREDDDEEGPVTISKRAMCCPKGKRVAPIAIACPMHLLVLVGC
jgi:hypothetical protein